jgi:hypothetical protein
MNRKSLGLFIVTLFVLAMFSFVVFPSNALAQVQNIVAPTINQVTYGTTIGPEVHNETAANNSAAGTVKLGLIGDWYVPAPIGVAALHPELTALMPFSIGNLPVQISSFDLDVDAKWVNGGGNATDPVTTFTITATLYDQQGTLPTGTAGPSGYSDPKVKTLPLSGTLTGNGFGVLTLDSTDVAPFVLSSGHNYYLAIDDYTDISVGAGYTNSTPTIVVTNEFGGTFGDSFSGFSTSFTWHTVPEPSTLALLSLGVIGLLARRRFASKFVH